MSWKPNEETIEIASEAPRDHKWTLDTAIEIAIALEEPKIREDERIQISSSGGRWANTIRDDQTRKIIEWLRTTPGRYPVGCDCGFPDCHICQAKPGDVYEVPFTHRQVADYIEREFG